MAPPVSVSRFPQGNTEKENTVNPVIKKFQYGQRTVTLETGVIARQASGAVLVSIDDISVLVTVVGAKQADAGQGLLPAVRALPGKDLRRRSYPGWLLQA